MEDRAGERAAFPQRRIVVPATVAERLQRIDPLQHVGGIAEIVDADALKVAHELMQMITVVT